jgi:integrase
MPRKHIKWEDRDPKEKIKGLAVQVTPKGVKFYSARFQLTRLDGSVDNLSTRWTKSLDEALKLRDKLREEVIKRKEYIRSQKVARNKITEDNLEKLPGIHSRVKLNGVKSYRATVTATLDNGEQKIWRSSWSESLEDTIVHLEKFSKEAKKVRDTRKRKYNGSDRDYIDYKKSKTLARKRDLAREIEKYNDERELEELRKQEEAKKPKGIEKRTSKSGKVSYRVNTFVNGEPRKTRWLKDYDKVVKELEHIKAQRVNTRHNNQYTTKNKDVPLKVLVMHFLAYSKTIFETSTYLDCITQTQLIFKDHMNIPLTQLKSIDWLPLIRKNYNSKKEDVDVSKNTLNARVSYLNNLNKFAESEEYPFKVNVEKLRQQSRTFRKSEGKTHFLSKEQARSLFKFLDDIIEGDLKNEEDVQAYCRKILNVNSQFYEDRKQDCIVFSRMAKISIYSGLRLGEILGLRYQDLDMDRKFINVKGTKIARTGEYKHGTKGRNKRYPTRIVPMSQHVFEVLTDILKENPDVSEGDYLFNRTHNWVQTQVRRLNEAKILPKGYSFHTFRHTFASLFFARYGTNPEVLLDLQRLMGHGNMKTTMRYVHLYKVLKGTLLDGLSFNETEILERERIQTDTQKRMDKVINLKINQDNISVYIPYKEDLIPTLNELGTWNLDKKVWEFPITVKPRLLKLLEEHFDYTPPEVEEVKSPDLMSSINDLLSKGFTQEQITRILS